MIDIPLDDETKAWLAETQQAFVNFPRWIREHVFPRRLIFNELWKKKLFDVHMQDRMLCLTKDRQEPDLDSLSSPVKNYVLGMMAGSDSEAIAMGVTMSCITNMVGDGIKAFYPTALECEALDQIAPRVPVHEYRQPFHTFVVAFPDDYLQQLSACGLIPSSLTRVLGDKTTIAYILVSYKPNNILTTAAFSTSGQVFPSSINLERDQTLEEALAERAALAQEHEGTIVSVKATRIAINAGLLMTCYKCDRKGYSEPEKAAKLQRRLDKNNQHREANELELRLIPEVYGFEQHIRLYRTEDHNRPEGDVGGWTVKPHWRKGHHTMQPYGPGHSLRKRIFREAVLVNEYLFAGDRCDTEVTITTE